MESISLSEKRYALPPILKGGVSRKMTSIKNESNEALNIDFKLLFDFFDTPILICSYDRTIKYINNKIKQIFSWTSEELIGECLDVMLYEKNFIEEDMISHDVKMKCGGIKKCNVKLQKFEDSKIILLKFDEIVIDTITKRKKELEQYYKSLCHDIRTGLQGILGSLEMIKVDELNCNQELFIENITAIVRNISTITKYKVDDACIPFKVKDLIDTQLIYLKSLIMSKKLNIIVDINNQNIFIYHRYNLFIKIIDNLILNCVKNCNEGEINIHTSIVDNNILFCINYNGSTMTTKKLLKINRYINFKETILNEDKNLEDDIYQVIDIIKNLNGSIKINSKKHIGTLIIVNIPMIEENSFNKDTQITDTFNKYQYIEDKKEILSLTVQERNKFNVLVVDDTLLILNLMKNFLNKSGYQCKTLNDGFYVSDELDKNNYDVILLDYQMPILNGYETAKKIRLNTKIKQPIIIILSGDDIHFPDVNINYYLVKPVEKNMLISLIDKFIIEKNLLSI